MSKQFYAFIGTLNNPDPVMCESYLEKWYKDAGAVFVTGQLEKGESETPHIQFYIHFEKKKKKTITGLKKHCPRANFTPVIFNNGADEYCNKDKGRLDGPWTFGIKPARKNVAGDTKRRNEQLLEIGTVKAVEEGHIRLEDAPKLERALQMLRLLGQTPYEHTTIRGEWHYGVPGAGKSHTVRHAYPDAYIKSQNKWFDGYQGEEVIILEDVDTDTLSHYMKIWADKWSCKGECKGYTVKLQHKKLIVTSNYSIDELFQQKGQATVEAIKRRFQTHHYPQPYRPVNRTQ